MRRCFSASALTAGACVCRNVHSLAVIKNVPPATKAAKLGVPVTREQVAKAFQVPTAMLDQTQSPLLIRSTEMDMARSTYAVLITSATEKDNFKHFERQVEEKYRADPAKAKPVPGALKKFKETEWKSLGELVMFYEETMYPIRVAHRAYKSEELTSFHIKDILKRGLSAFKQDFLDEQKKEQGKVKAEMKKYQDFIAACVSDAFDTAVCNDIANVLRIAGERHEQAHAMAVKILDDMNMMGVAYDDVTREILKACVFNDGPFDDSELLFEVIEYPERGEISVSKQPLKNVSQHILRLISNRHQTPLDADHTLLYSKETHPNLQRSPE